MFWDGGNDAGGDQKKDAGDARQFVRRMALLDILLIGFGPCLRSGFGPDSCLNSEQEYRNYEEHDGNLFSFTHQRLDPKVFYSF